MSEKPTQVTVAPGVTFSFSIALDKIGSNAVAQFHLPLGMDDAEMHRHTRKAMRILELEKLRIDADMLELELKLSAGTLVFMKADLIEEHAKQDAAKKGKHSVATSDKHRLLMMDNDYKKNQALHDQKVLRLQEMKDRLNGAGL